MTTIGSVSAVIYPKAVSIDDNTTHLSFNADGVKSFDIDNVTIENFIQYLVTARPTATLIPANIRFGVDIYGVVGDNDIGLDPYLLPANLKPGITIDGVTSNMATLGNIAGTNGSLQVTMTGNIKTGVTIFGVTSTMPAGTNITGGSGVTHIPVPAGYYDGTTFVDYTA
jgi:hypothetical protein